MLAMPLVLQFSGYLQFNGMNASSQIKVRPDWSHHIPKKRNANLSVAKRRLLRYGLALGFPLPFHHPNAAREAQWLLESWRSSIFLGRMGQFSPIFTWLWYAFWHLVCFGASCFFDVKNILERFR